MQHSNDIDLGRYSRQTMLREIGEEGQRSLLSSSVLIVGLGGLGAAVATYLTGGQAVAGTVIRDTFRPLP